ncbi:MULTISPECIES: RluA family pseudouridine synthase [unclassified Apibacter]|uniref:RluA family pseudouridine synthase n=1 Tax=unclassified Apibacter TaxID=2630820 RepID=UPI000CF8E1CA|nr:MULTISPECIES: RluA family pseudouridine synthase [unclassified Apibacter]MCX8677240.1 RluA family pseudouridine synthase [Apibacter sp. B3919]MXO23664.1 RNA pseudouridine synthase [Apibacter sp. B3924]MXO26713.1 RNA pseudouridine synthase [Apibacter sp. B3813]MXO28717.1 RNA pseudouridine synthase [Apibacter sp. B3913]MXO30671.1 RNA pseudouridine synthase [Apibacter sp. B3912]
MLTENQILFEDNHIIIINKKAGQLVQGDKTGDISLLDEVKSYIKQKYSKPGNVFAGLVHRIDRPTSGIVIFAKTSKALTRLTEMIKKREIKKTYWAVVKKNEIPETQRLVHYLKKNEKNNKAIIFNSSSAQSGSKEAILTYKIIKKSDHYLLLEIDLETGRHHQIRAQLSAIKCPIKGDLKYGADRSNSDGSIHLLARKIEFIHPIKKEKIVLEAPVPENDNLWKSFEN